MSRLAALVLAAALAGCARPEFTPSPSGPRFPPYEGEVQLLPRIPEEHVMLGTLLVESPTSVSEARMRRSLLEKAAASGANAIVLQGPVRTRRISAGELQQLGAWAIRVPEL